MGRTICWGADQMIFPSSSKRTSEEDGRLTLAPVQGFLTSVLPRVARTCPFLSKSVKYGSPSSHNPNTARFFMLPSINDSDGPPPFEGCRTMLKKGNPFLLTPMAMGAQPSLLTKVRLGSPSLENANTQRALPRWSTKWISLATMTFFSSKSSGVCDCRHRILLDSAPPITPATSAKISITTYCLFAIFLSSYLSMPRYKSSHIYERPIFRMSKALRMVLPRK